MNVSLHTGFLSQIIGLYFLITAVIMLYRAKYYRKIMGKLESAGTIIVAASFGLVIGLILVITHNIWRFNFQGLVTLIGWLILLKSIFWLAFPEHMSKKCKKCCTGWPYYVSIVVTGLIGLALAIHGFCMPH